MGRSFEDCAANANRAVKGAVGAASISMGSAATLDCDETNPLLVWPQMELPRWEKSMGSVYGV